MHFFVAYCVLMIILPVEQRKFVIRSHSGVGGVGANGMVSLPRLLTYMYVVGGKPYIFTVCEVPAYKVVGNGRCDW